MIPEDDRPNWNRAIDAHLEAMDLQVLGMIRDFCREYYEHTGDWPTPLQIREHLKRPGA